MEKEKKDKEDELLKTKKILEDLKESNKKKILK